ncbi:MAG: T9SS type A sorting domain-containing protein [Bacteroidetes bacterium]|nr:T9SS type A sorting domain-containing protein [Bacteroidota bacterium]
MRIIFTSLFFIAFFSVCQSQIVAVRQVIGNTGKDTLIGTTNWAWTVGEPVIDTYESSIGIFTQGFHQPDGYSITPGTPYINNLVIYPNPGKPNSTLSFYLRTDRPSLTILIYDAGGKLYQRQALDSYAGQTWHSLNPQIMAGGTYVVKVVAGFEVYTGRYIVVN